jgi:hypothetical protein
MEMSSNYGTQEEYEAWVERQSKLTEKYESRMLETMGIEADSVAETLIEYLPEDITNDLLEGVGLAVFVYDEEEVQNHGEIVYKDQNITITKQGYAPQEKYTDNLIRDLVEDMFSDSEVLELPEKSENIPSVEIIDPEKEVEPMPIGNIYNVWVRVETD